MNTKLKDYLEDMYTFGDLVTFHKWIEDPSYNCAYVNECLTKIEHVFTLTEFKDAVNSILIDRLLQRLESIRDSADI